MGGADKGVTVLMASREPLRMAGQNSASRWSTIDSLPRAPPAGPSCLPAARRQCHMLIIIEDLRAQREGLLGLGYWALLVYRFGHARRIVKNRLLRLPWTVAYLVLNKLIEIFCGITIGADARIGRRLCIEHHG